MIKLTCPMSTSRGVWHSLGIEPRSRNSHRTSSTITPRTHKEMDDFKQPAQSRGLLQQCNNKTDRGSTVLGQHQQEEEETGKEVREITLLSLLNKGGSHTGKELSTVSPANAGFYNKMGEVSSSTHPGSGINSLECK